MTAKIKELAANEQRVSNHCVSEQDYKKMNILCETLCSLCLCAEKNRNS